MSELKPCPFCGSPAKLSISEEGPQNELYHPPYAQIFCTVCSCAKTPIRATKEWEAGRGYFSVEPAAIAWVTNLWNRRPTAQGPEDKATIRYERTAHCLMLMMQAYERRIRSECKTPEQLAAEPWRCGEFVQAEDVLRKGWTAHNAPDCTPSAKAKGES